MKKKQKYSRKAIIEFYAKRFKLKVSLVRQKAKSQAFNWWRNKAYRRELIAKDKVREVRIKNK
ncbi:hypothetical protein [Runella limosa]|uniref:hypothetical protein n=1 Tax=Runella limosa TaxID=370978 RepID=UPI00048C3915|nr:hypothetical protein [Runella limosa]